jgi:hypothetical protein
MRFVFPLFSLLILLSSCSTTQSFIRMAPDYSTLPVDALTQAAREIEGIVKEGNADFNIADREGLIVDTPTLHQAIRTRALRSPLVDELRDGGHSYESSNGLLYIRTNGAYQAATTKLQRNRNAMMVISENQDRWLLYEGIIEAGHFPQSALSAIEDAFFKARAELMTPGQLIKGADGKIAEKSAQK